MTTYESPAWAEDGMKVWIRWDPKTIILCVVVTAAGDKARVVSGRKYGVDKWLHLDHLLVPQGDKHTYDQLPQIISEITEGLKGNSV